jgi:hypothetical protein
MDWYDVLHPGARAKDRKPKVKPLAIRLRDDFAAQYGDPTPKDKAA